MIEIKWSDPSLDDMENIRYYIAKDSTFYANRFIERIFDHVEKLTDFPEMGRVVPETDDRKDLRELVYRAIASFIC